MSKLNNLDKMVKTLREQGFGAKAIRASKTGAWARCRRFVGGLMRRVQLWHVLQVSQR